MTLKEANKKLNKLGYNIRSDEGVNYDSGKRFYETWVEYRRKDGRWGVLNTIGRFDTQDEGVTKSVGWIKNYTGGEVDIAKDSTKTTTKKSAMARKPSFNEFIESLGPERYYMDGELSRAQAAKYWRDVYNRRYSSVSMRSRTIKTATKGNIGG